MERYYRVHEWKGDIIIWGPGEDEDEIRELAEEGKIDSKFLVIYDERNCESELISEKKEIDIIEKKIDLMIMCSDISASHRNSKDFNDDSYMEGLTGYTFLRDKLKISCGLEGMMGDFFRFIKVHYDGQLVLKGKDVEFYGGEGHTDIEHYESGVWEEEVRSIYHFLSSGPQLEFDFNPPGIQLELDLLIQGIH